MVQTVKFLKTSKRSSWIILLLSILGCSVVGCNQGSSRSVAIPSSKSSVQADNSSKVVGSEEYRHFEENPFVDALTESISTFSVDVDTASYSNVRRLLRGGSMPPPGAVRIEELINYFDYDRGEVGGVHPLAVTTELAECPWNREHRLLRVAVAAKSLDAVERKPLNLVFLLDVSGSMAEHNKLPLVQASMRLLVRQLQPNDSVAIAVYAGKSGVALRPTSASRADDILQAIDSLTAAGGTAGSEGIQLAYQLAQQQFSKAAVNRVILCTDGDFNLGISDQSSLVELIKSKAKSGVELTVLGFGTGNYKDATMEMLAQHGNGNFGYIDTIQEAQRALVEELGSTLQTVARDVKIQVEFNPRWAAKYRLIGYENRRMLNEDFRDDGKDAGEVGAGHFVTALYEIHPQNESESRVNQSVFVSNSLTSAANSETMAIVRLRYKDVDSDRPSELEVPVACRLENASQDLRMAASVAGFGMLLRKSSFIGSWTWQDVIDSANECRGRDPRGMRAEFVQLAKLAQKLDRKQ